MTDREIKLELAKVVLGNGMAIETAKVFYKWIMEETEHVYEHTRWDDTPIEQLADLTRIKGTIIKRCHDNNINTIGDLIRCGAREFSRFRLVGKGTITKIDDARVRNVHFHFDVRDEQDGFVFILVFCKTGNLDALSHDHAKTVVRVFFNDAAFFIDSRINIRPAVVSIFHDVDRAV